MPGGGCWGTVPPSYRKGSKPTDYMLRGVEFKGHGGAGSTPVKPAPWLPPTAPGRHDAWAAEEERPQPLRAAPFGIHPAAGCSHLTPRRRHPVGQPRG
jgi:hypothetical protein